MAGKKTNKGSDKNDPAPKLRKGRLKASRPMTSGYTREREPRKHRGRTPLLTDEVIRSKLYSAMRAGCTYEVSAAAAGVDATSIMIWKQKADRDEADGKQSVYRDFFAELAREAQTGEAILAARIFKASEVDWRAAAHTLACRSRDRWSKSDRFEVSGAQGGPIGVQLYLPALESDESDDAE